MFPKVEGRPKGHFGFCSALCDSFRTFSNSIKGYPLIFLKLSVCKKNVKEPKRSLFGFFGIMRRFLPNTFSEKFNFFPKANQVFLMFPEQKKLFLSFSENPFGIFRHCVINKIFHNRLSFFVNIIEP